MNLRRAAHAYHARGIAVIPVRVYWNAKKKKWEKIPLVERWQEVAHTATSVDIDTWFGLDSCNGTGIVLGGITRPSWASSTSIPGTAAPTPPPTTPKPWSPRPSAVAGTSTSVTITDSGTRRSARSARASTTKAVRGFVVAPPTPGYRWFNRAKVADLPDGIVRTLTPKPGPRSSVRKSRTRAG